MRPTYFATLGVMLIGCVESAPDSMPARLVVEPANLSMTVVDGKPIAQPFTATLIDGDGVHDVTAQTTFVLADQGFGTWSASTLEVDGAAVGPTRVIAAHGDLGATAALTVSARTTRNVDAPDGVTALFERASDDPSCQPAISYPQDNVVVPHNFGQLDVQWSDAHDDLFEVSLATTYLETRIYTRRANDYAGWAKLAGKDWTRLADQHEPITIRVTGLVEADPALRCVSPNQHVYVTDQPLTGRLFMTSSEGMYRFDASHPLVAPEQLFSAELWDALFAPIVGGTPATCIGCSVSRDGSRLSVASSTAGAIYDFAQDKLIAPGAQTWSFSSFNAAGTKLITSEAGDLRVITDDGTLLTTLQSNPGYQAFDPQVSPDGRWLANVDAVSGSMYFSATIVTRQFFDGSNEMGGATEVVPMSPGTSNYYPAWSPDGQYLVFTRATNWGTADTTAAIWIVRADGTQAPIQLTAPAIGLDVRARFVPQLMTVDGERLYYITFESRAAYGEQLAAGRMQLWAMPFYPDRGVGSPSPCSVTLSTCTTTFRTAAPAVRLPMQSLETDNHVIQWIE